MTWTISITSTGVATIANTTKGNGNLQYNSGSPRFTTYTSNMQAISIYKLTAVATGA